uniref:Secreted protein n=1 Tax=Kalanchoe fedtschenkoi TaxID=63787 RepID=A0A7N0VAE5_KALFE
MMLKIWLHLCAEIGLSMQLLAPISCNHSWNAYNNRICYLRRIPVLPHRRNVAECYSSADNALVLHWCCVPTSNKMKMNFDLSF